MINLLIINIIKIYQKTISPDHGVGRFFYPTGCCKYRPTCSDYAIDAVKKYGIIKASPKIISRILHCNPWSKGGHDPVK